MPAPSFVRRILSRSEPAGADLSLQFSLCLCRLVVRLAAAAIAAAAVWAAFAGAASAAAPDALSAASAARTIRVGIMSFTSEGEFTTHVEAEDRLLKEIGGILGRSIPGWTFEASFFRMDALEAAVREGRVDLFLASSGFFWSMQRKYGARDLATLVSDEAPDPNRGVAGVIFVRKDRTDLQRIADLRGRRIAAGKPNMFLAYQLAAGEVAAEGFSPERFASIRHDDLPGETVVPAVLSGEADAGFLRACVLEFRYPDWRRSLRILAEKNGDGLACAHSSSLYPNWTLAATARVPPEASKRVAAALLAMPPDHGLSWSLATDFKHVDELERALQIGPYAYLDDRSLAGLWMRWKEWIIAAGALFAGLLAHLLRVEKLVARRTRDLTQEIERRQALEKKNAAIRERMARLERMQIVGELSTMIAHDLKQPLAAAGYFADGAAMLLRKGRLDPALLAESLSHIRSQITRMSGIVERVRRYAKSDASRDERVSMKAVLARVLSELRPAEGASVSATGCAGDPLARGSGIEIEAALLNLFRNAVEAACAPSAPPPEDCGLAHAVEASWREQNGLLSIEIENAGPKLSPGDVEAMQKPFASGKPGGLGLGIAIARSVAEAHAGGLAMEARCQGGVRAVLTLPLAKDAGEAGEEDGAPQAREKES